MTKQAKSANVLICTAVEGCTAPAFNFSQLLPDGRRARICAKHLMRLRRHGSLEAQRAPSVGLSKDPRGNRSAAERMAELQRKLGYIWICTGAAVGTYNLAPSARNWKRRASIEVAIATVNALARRGWIEVEDWRSDGSRIIRVTEEFSKYQSETD